MVLIDVPPIGSSSVWDRFADASENLIMVIPYLDLIQVHERLKERMLVADLKLLGYIFNGGPSRSDFSPYYPILYDFRSEVPGVAAPQERALPITVSSSVRSSSPRHRHRHRRHLRRRRDHQLSRSPTTSPASRRLFVATIR